METSTFISTIKTLQSKISTTRLKNILSSDEEVATADAYLSSINSICNSLLSINQETLVTNLIHGTYLTSLRMIEYFDKINVAVVTTSGALLSELSNLFLELVHETRILIGLATLEQVDFDHISKRKEELDKVLLEAKSSLDSANVLKADIERIKMKQLMC